MDTGYKNTCWLPIYKSLFIYTESKHNCLFRGSNIPMVIRTTLLPFPRTKCYTKYGTLRSM